VSATLHRLPSTGSQLITKQQLAAHLQRSSRWIELRVNEGMPSENKDRYGRRMFDLRAVEDWLAHGEPKATTLPERVEALEAEMAELRAIVERLGGGNVA
jgi:hypothetical protein